MKLTATWTCCLLAFCIAMPTLAETFGSGVNTFDIEFVTIGSPGNPTDTTGNPNPAGKVDYMYRIGKYEISEQMINKVNALSNLGITIDTRGPDRPASSVSWFEAARFVNWLNTSLGHTPAYKFDDNDDFQLWEEGDAGFNPDNHFRNSLAHYFLPSTDEWYKSAYYDPSSGNYFDYATGSDTIPTRVPSGNEQNTAVFHDRSAISVFGPAEITLAGGTSPFGTVGQGGNVSEWEETSEDLLNNSPSSPRSFRGGRYNLDFGRLLSSTRASILDPIAATAEGEGLGFRVASIPEPSALLQALVAMFASLLRRNSASPRSHIYRSA